MSKSTATDVYKRQGQMRSDFLVEYYSARTDAIPKQIYIDKEMEDSAILEEYFSALCGHKVTVTVAQRGEGLSRVLLAKQNASEYLSMKVGRTVKEINALEDLAKPVSYTHLVLRHRCHMQE